MDQHEAHVRAKLKKIGEIADRDPLVRHYIAAAAREPERRAQLERVAREAGTALADLERRP